MYYLFVLERERVQTWYPHRGDGPGISSEHDHSTQLLNLDCVQLACRAKPSLLPPPPIRTNAGLLTHGIANRTAVSWAVNSSFYMPRVLLGNAGAPHFPLISGLFYVGDCGDWWGIWDTEAMSWSCSRLTIRLHKGSVSITYMTFVMAVVSSVLCFFFLTKKLTVIPAHETKIQLVIYNLIWSLSREQINASCSCLLCKIYLRIAKEIYLRM